MKNVFLLFFIASAFILKAQNYSFTKSTGTYVNLAGTTIVANNNWTAISAGIKFPFPFKFWGNSLPDSIYVDDFGSISLDNNYNDDISFFFEDLNSRGTGKSIVSYKVEGVTPNRIFKLEYMNVGFDGNLPSLTDSANVQCWMYETSNIIEFRYGPGKVKASTWADGGAYVDMTDIITTKIISIEGDPANPTVNKTDLINMAPLNGMPVNGTIYKFTPNTGVGINNLTVKLDVSRNKILLHSSLEVITVTLCNASGQILQSVTNAEQIDLSGLPHGFYLVKVATTTGLISSKIVL